MKKVTFAILALVLAFSAHATKPGNNGGGDGGCGVGQTTNGCAPSSGNKTAEGGDGGTGIGVGVGVGIGQGGKASSQVRNKSLQSTQVIVEGDSVQSDTPPVMPGVLPSVPTSCRLYLFGGGSTRDGAGSGTFPIGNDQTCLSIAALNLMERAGGFTQTEKQAVVCKVEGMSTMETCKNLGTKKSASAVNTAAPIGFEHANLSDPSIRRRAGLPPLQN